MKKSLLALAAAVLLTATARAEELRRDLIPDDATRVGYLDLRALEQTKLYQALKQGKLGARIEFGMQDMVKKIGFDPLKAIESATVFGKGREPQEGVALIHCTSEVDGLLTAMQGEQAYSTIKQDGFRIHVWDGDGEKGYIYVAGEPDSDQRWVFLSTDLDHLLWALRVADGRAKSLADEAKHPLAARPTAGSFLYLEAIEIPKLEGVEPASAVGQMAKSFLFDVGEREGELQAELRVTTADAEDARNVAMVLQGATALFQLAQQKEPQLGALRPLIEALDVESEGTTVKLEFEYDSLELLKILAQLQEH